jgi:hypothetical protein
LWTDVRNLLTGAIFVAVLAAPLAAHDHWIAPSSFRPAAGERVDLRLCVGHPGDQGEQARDPRRFRRFERCSTTGEKYVSEPILGIAGRSPAGFFVAEHPGLLTLVYESNHAFVSIEPPAYALFLEEEGLDDVRAERERRGETQRAGTDSYLRSDKALVRVGDGPTPGFDRTFGLPIELVLETDPWLWKPGDALLLRLEADGQPLAGRLVELVQLREPYASALVRTDELGLARFEPATAGAVVAFSLHQRRALPEQGLEGDWEGLWTSLSFELGPGTGAAPRAK